MKNFLALVFLVLYSSTCLAQHKEDVLYLRNGSVIRGNLLLKQNDSIVKILSIDGNIWAFKKNELDSVTRENSVKRNDRYIKNKTGYNFITDLGLFPPLRESSQGFISIGMVHLYNVVPNFSGGIGINLDLEKYTMIPVYFDIHYFINRKYMAPCLHFSIGHTFPKEKEVNIEYRTLDNKGGLYCATGFGIEIPQNDHLSLLLDFTWRYQQVTYKSRTGEEFYELIDKNNRFALKFGILFR